MSERRILGRDVNVGHLIAGAPDNPYGRVARLQHRTPCSGRCKPACDRLCRREPHTDRIAHVEGRGDPLALSPDCHVTVIDPD